MPRAADGSKPQRTSLKPQAIRSCATWRSAPSTPLVAQRSNLVSGGSHATPPEPSTSSANPHDQSEPSLHDFAYRRAGPGHRRAATRSCTGQPLNLRTDHAEWKRPVDRAEVTRRRAGCTPNDQSSSLLSAYMPILGTFVEVDRRGTLVRPAVFVGSSSEGLEIARAVQYLLDMEWEVALWNQGIFGLSHGTLESLVLALPDFDYAILVLTADDLSVSRGHERAVARDNVMFELGFFIGALGRERTFMIYDRTKPPALPSDLAGITATTFAPHANGNLEAALGAPSTKILGSIKRLGLRENRELQNLERATETVEEAGAIMQTLLRLLARSRKVELDIIAKQFGMLIDPNQLAQMKKDLVDLQNALPEE